MYDCELWETAEKQIVLNYIEEDFSDNIAEINRCLKALRELEPFMRPLSVEFGVKCRHRQKLAYSFEIKPEVSYWHWEVSPVPEEILTWGMYTGLAKVIPVNNISIDNLQHWVKEPLQQQCLNPDYELRWSEICIWATRAKVTNETNLIGKESFWVKSAAGKLEYPLLREKDGVWVYGPKQPYGSYPPIKILLHTHTSSHKMTIYTAWSMCYDIESPGYLMLYEAIQRIIAQGWEYIGRRPLNEPKYAA